MRYLTPAILLVSLAELPANTGQRQSGLRPSPA